MKKIPKYIFYAVGAAAILLVLYVLFQSTRETFTSVNPIPSDAEMTALQASFDRAMQDGAKNNIPLPQRGTNTLQSAPQSVKAVAKFLKANVLPLLPYSMAKAAQTPDGDITDYMIVYIMLYANKPFIAPLAYDVRQQSRAPTLPEFVDMSVKILKDNSQPALPADWPKGTQEQFVIADMKKGETTVQAPQTIPNPAYWTYKYIYGEPKATKTGSPAKGSSGSPTLGSSKCIPSIHGIPGGMTETRCFN